MCPLEEREKAWEMLARELDRKRLSTITNTIGLADAPSAAGDVLAGKVRGRLVVDVDR
jgi:acrylyl-CoA reductase (NADPH)